jgi:hypothetical protein
VLLSALLAAALAGMSSIIRVVLMMIASMRCATGSDNLVVLHEKRPRIARALAVLPAKRSR